MIEVSRFIHEFDVGKTQAECDGSQSVPVADCNKKCSQAADDEEEVSIAPYWFYPAETVIGKMKTGFDVELLNPTVSCKTYQAQKHH